MSDYPVQLSVDRDQGQNRLWGIPYFGFLLRVIVIIPVAIILWFVAIAVGFLTLVSWIPILLNGRMAGWGYSIIGGYLRLSTRTALYVLLITGRYPPFGLGGDHTVELTFDQTESQSRLWGIPFVGLFVRWILLIPHFFVLAVLGIGIALLTLVTWLPVLVMGRQAGSIVSFFAGYYRWGVRVSAYALLLTGKYPPFSFAG
jgi:hypothetical protein